MENVSSLLEHVLKREVASVTPIGGGSISTAMKATLGDGEILFVKVSPQQKDMFPKEANGLRELAKADAVKVPRVICVEENVLIIEFLRSSSPSNRKTFFAEFGRQFAALHRCTSSSFGFAENNYIGSTPQQNTPRSSSWKEFYQNYRLQFQFHLAEKNRYVDAELRRLYTALDRRLDELIPDDGEPPALLHGDLWGGNFLCVEGNIPAIIDPAVYYGHREADLAMTMLFGGFGDSFYSAYDEVYPLKPGWKKRIELYKLYHLFNHLNLFGRGYYGEVVGTMKALAV
ncbi:MAG: fructosamine kinase family protein [Bacteroidota bacterium]